MPTTSSSGAREASRRSWRRSDPTALESPHVYALLYRAHCLHDQERWTEAVEAYRAVPLETFKGPKAWLVEIVQEAQAYCLLQAGDRASAISELTRLLERLEKEPKRAEMLNLTYLTEACRGPLREELWPAYCRLSRLIGPPS
jgi:tetratricopeptide (TPR) repeat protein